MDTTMQFMCKFEKYRNSFYGAVRENGHFWICRTSRPVAGFFKLDTEFFQVNRFWNLLMGTKMQLTCKFELD